MRGKSCSGYYFPYYERDAHAPGFWFGRGADLLGLPVEVSKKHFDNLLAGFSPDGSQKLVQNAGETDRRGFWDLTLSVPKSLSVLYAASPEMAAEIRRAVETAVRSTLMEVEDSLGMSRQLKNGTLILPAALLFGVFGHETNRDEEPQLHYHCGLINSAVRMDGTTGAVFSKPIYEEKNNIGRLFREKLATELTQRFGLTITMGKDSFEIEGVSKALCAVFSKRSKQLRDYMEKHDLKGAVGAKRAAIETRGQKKHTDRETLFRKWGEEARSHGLTPEKVENIWKRGQEKLKERVKPSEQNEREQERTSAKQDGPSPKEKPSKARSKKEERERLAAFRAFERELRAARDKIYTEKQTRPRLMKVGFALAYKHGVDRNLVEGAVDKLKLPVQRRFYRTEWAQLFPNAPGWSGMGNIRAPKIVLRNKRRRWREVTSKVVIPSLGSKNVSIAVQRRSLFPNSPFEALRNITLPAVRLRKDAADSKPSLPETHKRKMRH